MSVVRRSSQDVRRPSQDLRQEMAFSEKNFAK